MKNFTLATMLVFCFACIVASCWLDVRNEKQQRQQIIELTAALDKSTKTVTELAEALKQSQAQSRLHLDLAETCVDKAEEIFGELVDCQVRSRYKS